MENSTASYQTDKFILKYAEKNGSWYVALMNKETEKTMIKNFKTERGAVNHYHKVLGLPKPEKITK